MYWEFLKAEGVAKFVLRGAFFVVNDCNGTHGSLGKN